MSDNETQADIAREMRTYFQTQKRNGNPEHRPWHQVLSDWADRIEAAEREMAKGMSKKLDGNRVISNAAEMRKALERILDIEGYGAPWIEAKVIAQKALEGEQCTPLLAQERPKNEQPGNAAALREALKAAKTLLENTDFDADSDLDDAAAPVMAQIAAALAAPPRNCDRFQTASEVSAYWNSNVRTVPLPHDAYGMHIDGETYPTFLDWLMAPTKEARDA